MSSGAGNRDVRQTAILTALVALWAAALAGGYWWVESYQNQAGAAVAGLAVWPQTSKLQRPLEASHLVMFAHPKCPCTRASLGELAKVLTRSPGLQATVVFFRPRDAAADWERTDLWRSAAAIPEIRCVVDPGGREAKRFGAATSGMTYLYDASGRLLYQGGVTASRGHHGDNAAADAVVAAARFGPASPTKFRTACGEVFGCPLVAPGTSRLAVSGD